MLPLRLLAREDRVGGAVGSRKVSVVGVGSSGIRLGLPEYGWQKEKSSSGSMKSRLFCTQLSWEESLAAQESSSTSSNAPEPCQELRVFIGGTATKQRLCLDCKLQ